MSIPDDLFEARIDAEVERRLKLHIDRIADNPDLVIEAYSQKLRDTQREMDAMRAHLEPKAEFYDSVTGSEDWSEMSTVVKVLALKGWGRNSVFRLLRDRRILRYNNEPYQDYVERGYFRLVEQRFENPTTGETMINKKPVVSQRGIDFIRRIIEEAE